MITPPDCLYGGIMKRTFFLVVLVVISLFYVAGAMAFENSPGPNSTNTPARVFDVRQFGAKGDGKTLDTAVIQKALDECGSAGGGIVRLSAGTYLSKPISLRSKTTLQLDEGAKLKATDDPQDFLRPGVTMESAKGSSAFAAFVNGKNLTDVTIAGKGIIDGSGARWWIPAEEARNKTPGFTSPRPRMVLLVGCKKVKVTGVTLVNSPSFHLVPKNCEDVVIEGVTIRALSVSPNTDAIDPSESRHVRISKCVIDVGDDNIAIKSGHVNPAHPNAACEDITVTDCTFLNGHGMSIGSETVGGVRDVTVQRCTFENTANGIRIKSARGKGGLVENITYSNITMKNVKIPISISSYYEGPAEGDSAQSVTSLTPIYRNIRITNLTATSPRGAGLGLIVDRLTDVIYYLSAYHAYLEPRSASAGLIAGLPECGVSDVVLENVRIWAPTGLTIRNAKAIKLNNVKIETQQGQPFILENAVVEGLEQTNR
jgi:polygalacturonase